MPRKRHYAKSEYSPKSPDQIRQLTRNLRQRLGIDDQRAPDIWALLLKLPEFHYRFKKKIVADDDLPHVEAKAYCDAFLLKIRESSENALKYFGDPRTRFTVAHELGHLILGHPGNNPRLALGDNNERVRIDPELEREANIFASELLMPLHLVEPSMTKGEISRLFQVSLDAAAIRIRELGLHAPDQSKLPVPLPHQRPNAPSNALRIARPIVFVSMAFSPVMNRLYAEIFRPTIESLGMQSLRADEIASVEPISLDIRRSIDDADLVIAEITDFNPNVMHEIGLAQSIDKPTIIICRMGYREDQIPSNIRHIRRIMYPNDAGGGPILRRHLQEILSLMCACFKPH